MVPSSLISFENDNAAPGKFVDLMTILCSVFSNLVATELTTPWKLTLLARVKETELPISDCNKADKSLTRQIIFSGKFWNSEGRFISGSRTGTDGFWAFSFTPIKNTDRQIKPFTRFFIGYNFRLNRISKGNKVAVAVIQRGDG